MESDRLPRKLSAILYSDVAGYSRLTGQDEEGTHRQLSAALDLITDRIRAADGHVVHYAGDAVLADFASVLAALECAVTVQRTLGERNAGIPDDQRLQFRIGINLGEVIVDRDDIYGDGVNIAARLESLADVGGICVSGAVFEQARGKLDVGFSDMGPQELKNIAQPIMAYRVLLDSPWVDDEPLALPDRPSIAVLPLKDLSGNPEQGLLADGMTEDIIAGLSRFRWLFVIARNSTFVFKGREIAAGDVARALGVRYILDGSVRTAGSRIRVATQLIDVATERPIWTDRYDHELDDLFALQDDVTEAIVAAIAPEIDEAERRRSHRTPPDSLDTWLLYQQGLAAYYATTEQGMDAAIAIFDRVAERDPTFSPAFAMAAETRARMVMHHRPDAHQALLERALEGAEIAIRLDQRDPIALLAMGRVQVHLGRHVQAIDNVERAIALNPNYAMAYYVLGFALHWSARHEEALSRLQHAIRLSPHDPFTTAFHMVRSLVLFALERFPEAVEAGQRACSSPHARPWAHAALAAALQRCGDRAAARDSATALLRRKPDFSITFARNALRNLHENLDYESSVFAAWRELDIPE